MVKADIQYWNILRLSYERVRSDLGIFWIIPIAIGLILPIGILIALQILALLASGLVTTPPSATFFGILGGMLIVNLLLLLPVGAFIRACFADMVMTILGGKRIDVKKSLNTAKGIWLHFFLAHLTGLIIILPGLLITAAGGILLYLESIIAGIILLMLGILLLIALGFVTVFGLLFIDPIIMIEKRSPWESVKFSFAYLKTKTTHVLLTFGVTFLVGITISLVSMLLIPIELLYGFLGVMEMWVAYWIVLSFYILLRILFQIVSIIVQIVLGVFIFASYIEGRKK